VEQQRPAAEKAATPVSGPGSGRRAA